MSTDVHEKRTQEAILPDDPTHEQIIEYVDQVTADVAGEDAGDKAADDDSTEGTDETKETQPGDEKSAEADPAANEGGEEPVDDDDAEPDWLDDDLRQQVSTLGISDEQLSEFSSRDELDRAMRFLDQGAMAAGRNATEQRGDQSTDQQEQTQQQDAARQRDPQGRFIKPEPSPEADENKPSGYQVQLAPEEYDEPIIQEFNDLRDFYESRLDAVESRFAAMEQAEYERAAQAAEAQFDMAVDSLGHADLFGESGKVTSEQAENRKTLFAEHQVYLAGLAAMGREASTNKALVNRVANMTFAEQISNKKHKALTKKVSKQSDMRMGGSATKPVDTPPTLEDEMETLFAQLNEQNNA